MNNQFKDMEQEGWARMNVLLNQKMPVKKSKRIILFWFLIPLAIGSVITYKYMSFTKATYSNPNEELIQNNSISNTIITNQTTTMADPISQANEIKTSFHNNRIHSIRNITSNNNSNIILDIGQISSRKNIQTIVLKDDDNNINHKPLKNDVLASPTMNEKSNEHDLILLPLKLVQISTLEKTSLVLISPKIISDIRPAPISKSKTKIQLGLQIGLNAYTEINQISSNVGLCINIPIYKKHSLSINPSLNIQKNNYLIFNGEQNEPLNYIINNFNQNNIDVFEDTFKNSKIVSDSFHLIYKKYLFQFQIPIYYSYTFNRHWKARLGTKLSISLNQLYPYQSNDIIQYNSKTIQGWSVRPIDYYLLLGTEYSINSTWSIAIDYDYGFQNPSIRQQTGPNTSTPNTSTSLYGFTLKKLDHFNISLKFQF